jgi:nucleoside-diphosphate-sugar epimerase
MKVFLTGATGYIGSAVMDKLLQARHQVVALARSSRSASRLREQGTEVVEADLANRHDYADILRSSDGVIHTAMEGSANAGLLDAGFVETVLEALSGSGKPFIYTSGVWVMGHHPKGGDEHSPLAPIPLVAWRVDVERRVLDAAAANNIRTVVLRPAMVYGRGGGFLANFVNSARQTGAATYVGDGQNHWSLVHVDDLADLYLLALDRAPAGSLFVAATHSVKTRDLAEAASRAAGYAGRVTPLAEGEARNVLGPALDGVLLDQNLSSAKAVSELGWQPKAPQAVEEFERSYLG